MLCFHKNYFLARSLLVIFTLFTFLFDFRVIVISSDDNDEAAGDGSLAK